MSKALKWAGKTAIIIAVMVVLFSTTLYFLVQLPSVQTMLVRQVTHSIQQQLPQSSIAVGSVHYAFFNKLIVNDIYASDIHGDTLLYVQTAAVNISSYSFTTRALTISAAHLYNGAFNLYDGPQTNNINEVLRALPKDTVDNNPELNLQIKDIVLSDFRFTYRNLRKPNLNPDPAVINFKDLVVNNIHVNIENLKIRQDTIFFRIKDINFNEKSGYRLRKLSAEQAYVCANQAMLRNMIIDDEHSLLTLNHYSMSFNSRLDFKDYTEKVVMSADFNNALFSLSTLNHYAKGIHADSIKLRLQGVAGGTVEKLRSQLLSIAMENGRTGIATSFRITGLPDIHQTAFNLNVRDLNTNADDLSHILKDLVDEDYTPQTEKMIGQLGDIQFKGYLDGLYDDFVIHGDVATSIGEAFLDMLFHRTTGKSFTAEGHTSVKHFNLGKFLNMKMLGSVSTRQFETRLTFRPSDEESFHLRLSGNVPQFEFNRYVYSGIKVDGLLSNRHFEGEVTSNDPNLMMDFKGYVAFNKDDDSTFALRHNYTADIRHANLQQLNFNTRDTISEVKTQLTANYQYDRSFDDGVGKIEASGAFYRNMFGVHNIGIISLLFSRDNDGYTTKLRSGFADADYRGPLPLFDFIDDLVYAAYLKQLPLLGDSARHDNARSSNYIFDVQLKRISELASIIHPKLTIGDQSGIKATLTPSGELSFNVNSPILALGNDYVRQIALQGGNRDSLLSLQLKVHAAQFLGFDFNNINVGIDAADNNVNTKIDFHNNSRLENQGALHFNTAFTPGTTRRSPIINIHLYPSTVTVNDTTWSVAPANVVINDRTLSVNRMSFYNQHQQIALQGVISPVKTDTLMINLHNFDVSNFNTFSLREGFNLKGVLSGNGRVAGVYDELMFHADFRGERIVVNDRPLDHIEVKSHWDNESKMIQFYAGIKEKGNTRMQSAGFYIPGKDSLLLHTSFRHFPLVNAEPLLDGVFSNVNGYLSGDVTAQGSLKSPQLYGTNVVLDSVGLTVDYLKTHYTLTAPVNITPELISIHDAEIVDNAGGKGVLNGSLKHRAFSDISYDMAITSNNLLCMNTTIRDNELFYGRAYATGMVQIKGDNSNIHFDITARTNPNTICHIPISNTSRAKKNSLLTFKEPEDDDVHEPGSKPQATPGQHVTVDMNLAATPAAEVQIVFDEKAGDIVRGRGNGNLQLSLDPSINKFDLFGNYAIEQGDYLFTLQNIISKKFIIEQGSHIAFNGDINKTTIDIIALYKTKAPLSTLILDTTSAVGNVRRPVDCRINITGNLFNPTLNYTADVQNLDPSTRAQVEAALNTEEKMSRQFLSLLTFNSFMPEDQSGISSINLSAGASEMLSNQLNNIFNQLNVPVDVGFIYNSATTNSEQSNIDMELSAQFFDSRLQVSAMSNSRHYNSNFTADIDIEVKLDRQGRFRGKAFSHSADQFTDQLDNSQRSGIGFIYQEDFNTFRELFERWFKRKKRDEE